MDKDIQIIACFPTENGGGKHEFMGLLYEDVNHLHPAQAVH